MPPRSARILRSPRSWPPCNLRRTPRPWSRNSPIKPPSGSCSSLLRVPPDPRGHGPDEFHYDYPDTDETGIDDNVYTNMLALRILARATELAETPTRERRADFL